MIEPGSTLPNMSGMRLAALAHSAMPKRIPVSVVHRALVGTVALFAILFAIMAGTSTAAAASFPWATQAGSAGVQTEARSVAALADGSSIVTGSFQGTVAFGTPTPTSLTSAGQEDIFVAKVNDDGSYAWAVRAGGESNDFGYGVSVHSDGSSIITGSFMGDATFDTPTPTELEWQGETDIFVAKVSATGSFVWAIKAGGPDYDDSYGVSVLADGSSIITGSFAQTATFGTLPTPTALTSDDTYDETYSDIFVAKVSATGSFVWAIKAGGPEYDVGYGVSTLADGSSIVTGSFQETATFGSSTLVTSAVGEDMFVTRLNANGTFYEGAVTAGGTGLQRGISVAALADGSSVVTGQFRPTARFETVSGVVELPSAGDMDVFVAKTGTCYVGGCPFAWATRAGGTGNDDVTSVSALADGSSIITGGFGGPLVGSPGPLDATFGSTTLTSAGERDIYVAKVKADGAHALATRAGGSGDDYGTAAAVLADGSAIITGVFGGSSGGAATFGSTTLTSLGPLDAFITRVVLVPARPGAPTATAANAQATVSVTPLADDSITGYTVTANPSGRTCTITPPATQCVISGLANGVAHTFTATATNAAGTSPASEPSNQVVPTAGDSAAPAPAPAPPNSAAQPAALKVRMTCKGTVCTTTGTLPAGATRIGQSATAVGKKAARATCSVKATGKGKKIKRTFACRLGVKKGTWTVTTSARAKNGTIVAQSVVTRRVK
jgi:hypothetical protein